MNFSISERSREARLRSTAERQGLRLFKSKRRDPRAIDYGTYILVDVTTNTVVCGGTDGGFQNGLDLDAVEQALNG